VHACGKLFVAILQLQIIRNKTNVARVVGSMMGAMAA
jgi:hypothetical protein